MMVGGRGDSDSDNASPQKSYKHEHAVLPWLLRQFVHSIV